MTLTNIILLGIAGGIFFSFSLVETQLKMIRNEIQEMNDHLERHRYTRVMEDILHELQVLVKYQEQDHGENTDRYDFD